MRHMFHEYGEGLPVERQMIVAAQDLVTDLFSFLYRQRDIVFLNLIKQNGRQGDIA